jgi:hypothetical protein
MVNYMFKQQVIIKFINIIFEVIINILIKVINIIFKVIMDNYNLIY